MKNLKYILLILLGFISFVFINSLQEILDKEVMQQPMLLLIYPAIIMCSAYYLQWLTRELIIPKKHLSKEQLNLINESSKCTKKSYKSISNIGYFILVMMIIDQIMISFSNKENHRIMDSPNMINYALFFLFLGVLIQAREQFILLANQKERTKS